MFKKVISSNKKSAVLVLILIIVQAALSAGLAVMFEYSISFAIQIEGGTLPTVDIVLIILGILLYILILVGIVFLYKHNMSSLRIKIIKEISEDYHNKVTSMSLKEFNGKHAGYYYARLLDDVPTLINDYVIRKFDLVDAIAQALCILIVAFYLNWILALIFIPVAGIIFLYTHLFRKRFSKIVDAKAAQRGQYIVELKSEFGGFDEIKYNNAEAQFNDAYSRSLAKTNYYEKKYFDLDSYYSSGNTLFAAAMRFIIIIGAIILYEMNLMSLSVLTGSIYVAIQFFDPVRQTFEQLTIINSNKHFAKEIYEDFVTPDPNKINEVTFSEKISLVDVALRYGKHEELVFEHVNLEIMKNKSYLLVGPSYSGKSTLLKVLTKTVDYKGSVLVDKIDIQLLSDKALFSLISYIDETPYIFSDTIRRNIDLCGQCTDEEIIAAANLVGLDTFLANRTLDTQITNESADLSVSYRQRIMLARALVRKTDILLLDEPTSSIDKELTDSIENTLLNMKGKTILYSCPDLLDEVVVKFDYVIKFDEGVDVHVYPSKEFIKLKRKEGK